MYSAGVSLAVESVIFSYLSYLDTFSLIEFWVSRAMFLVKVSSSGRGLQCPGLKVSLFGSYIMDFTFYLSSSRLLFTVSSVSTSAVSLLPGEHSELMANSSWRYRSFLSMACILSISLRVCPVSAYSCFCSRRLARWSSLHYFLTRMRVSLCRFQCQNNPRICDSRNVLCSRRLRFSHRRVFYIERQYSSCWVDSTEGEVLRWRSGCWLVTETFSFCLGWQGPGWGGGERRKVLKPKRSSGRSYLDEMWGQLQEARPRDRSYSVIFYIVYNLQQHYQAKGAGSELSQTRPASHWLLNRTTQQDHITSYLFLLLEADVDMRFVLPGLFVESLQYFIGVGVDVEVHFLVVVFEEVVGVAAQHLVDEVVGLEISGLPRDYVDDHVLKCAFGSAVLEVDGGGGAGVEALHGAGEQLQGEGEVEHLYGLQF